MKKNLRCWAAVAAAAAVVALAFPSCAYDPNYGYAGGTYTTGYGDGYGYGGSQFSTSILVSTGDARWGYDPYCYSYYDYHRRCYYDPYLYGYYPVGYRPQVIIGAPHPHGWRPGHGYCPPPHRVSNVMITNYSNRESAYRNSSYTWARQVRIQPVSRSRAHGPSYPAHRSDSQPYSQSYRKSSGNSSGNSYPKSSNKPYSSSNNYQLQKQKPGSSNYGPNTNGHPSNTYRTAPPTGSSAYRSAPHRDNTQYSQTPKLKPGQSSAPSESRRSYQSGSQGGSRNAASPSTSPPQQRSHGNGDRNQNKDSNSSNDRKDSPRGGLRGLGQD